VNRGSSHRNSPRLHSKAPSETVKARPEVLARVKHLWVCLRGFTRFLTVYFAHLRRLNSADTVKNFVLQLGEWSRMRSAMRRMLHSVTFLQQVSRGFFSIRSKRCEGMHREWQRVEDSYLQAFFKLYAFRCMEERVQKHEDGDGSYTTPTGHRVVRQKTRKLTESLTKFGREESDSLVGNAVDWKCMRIPSLLRKVIINRYYMVELARYIRRKDSIAQTMRRSKEDKRDKQQLLQCFGQAMEFEALGGDMATMALGELNPVMPEFWHLREETAWEMICMAAHHLRDDTDQLWHQKPLFRSHPGNKTNSLPEHEYDKFCRPARKLEFENKLAISTELEGCPLSRAEVFRQAERHALGQRIASRNSTAASTAAKARAPSIVNFAGDASHSVDLDDVWRDFTPRMQQTVEEQSAAWMEDTQERDERLDDLSPERISIATGVCLSP